MKAMNPELPNFRLKPPARGLLSADTEGGQSRAAA